MSVPIKAFFQSFFRWIGSISLKSWLVILGGTLFLLSWFFGNQGLYELEHLLRMKRGLLNQQQELHLQKEALEAELKHLENPRYMKHLIHEEMGFVESDELLIKFSKKK